MSESNGLWVAGVVIHRERCRDLRAGSGPLSAMDLRHPRDLRSQSSSEADAGTDGDTGLRETRYAIPPNSTRLSTPMTIAAAAVRPVIQPASRHPSSLAITAMVATHGT